MAAGRIIIPRTAPLVDSNNNPVPGGLLYFYENGTTDIAPVYTSSAMTTQLSNPVVADAVGVFPAIWADTADEFTVAATKADGTPLPGFTYDAISASVDATLASVDLAEAAKISAQASATAAAASEVDAEAAQVAAEAAQAAAEAAAANAEEISGFTPGAYQLTAQKGVANGYAPLNGSGKVPDTHLTDAPISTAQQAALNAKQSTAQAATDLADAKAFAIVAALVF